MGRWTLQWKEVLRNRRFVLALLGSIVFIVVGWLANTAAITFATNHASNSVEDLILSRVPIFEVDALFVYGTFIFALFGMAVVLPYPKRIPFVLATLGLFWVIRSGFTILTHMAPFDVTPTDFGPRINEMFFGADRFFSAHTGMPFLGALAFWEKEWIRYVFLGGSVFFGVIVLLGHLHYSIDVAAACFITFGIFHIAKKWFPQSRDWFYEDLKVGR